MKIFLDPGHGGSDPGAINRSLGVVEKDIALDIAQRTKVILQNKGYTVVMSRTTDEFVSLESRVNMANKSNANYFVSIHVNSALTEEANGIETYYYPTSIVGSQFAITVQTQLINQLKLKDRGVKPRDLYVLRKTKMPAILTEIGFLSNTVEGTLLSTKEFKQRAAQALADGIMQFAK